MSTKVKKKNGIKKCLGMIQDSNYQLFPSKSFVFLLFIFDINTERSFFSMKMKLLHVEHL